MKKYFSTHEFWGNLFSDKLFLEHSMGLSINVLHTQTHTHTDMAINTQTWNDNPFRTGWWFGCHFLISHILGMSSSQLTFIFSEGWPNHQPFRMYSGFGTTFGPGWATNFGPLPRHCQMHILLPIWTSQPGMANKNCLAHLAHLEAEIWRVWKTAILYTILYTILLWFNGLV